MKGPDFDLGATFWVADESNESNKTEAEDNPLSALNFHQKAEETLRLVMEFRRMVTGESCRSTSCPRCHAPHLDKLRAATAHQQPIRFILPAFPGKSPNPAKVLGTLPDMAEKQALRFLNKLCNQIGRLYAPGAEMIICSDGRVFSDIVGIPEHDITAYQNELEQIIKEDQLQNISTFNLDELCRTQSFDEIRKDLMNEYGQSLESLRTKVRRGGKQDSENPEDKESHRMYCGITRFLFEDSLTPGQTKSRTAIQKTSRAKAYEVIRRSNAWSELLAEQFPEAIRLSIHPQACGAKKLGIQLLGTQTWMTPWHGVAVDTGKGFVLMKRWEAEELKCQIVRDPGGRPSHFKMVKTNGTA